MISLILQVTQRKEMKFHMEMNHHLLHLLLLYQLKERKRINLRMNKDQSRKKIAQFLILYFHLHLQILENQAQCIF